MNTTQTAEQLFDSAFNIARDPRSDEYRQGVRAALSRKVEGIHIECPYRMGSVEADAFYAGAREGIFIWNCAQQGEA